MCFRAKQLCHHLDHDNKYRYDDWHNLDNDDHSDNYYHIQVNHRPDDQHSCCDGDNLKHHHDGIDIDRGYCDRAHPNCLQLCLHRQAGRRGQTSCAKDVSGLHRPPQSQPN